MQLVLQIVDRSVEIGAALAMWWRTTPSFSASAEIRSEAPSCS
ncbi:hypothetical protein ACFQV8_20635 [Pseudonocardia benzenivorans]